jgi:hypothetical protein
MIIEFSRVLDLNYIHQIHVGKLVFLEKRQNYLSPDWIFDNLVKRLKIYTQRQKPSSAPLKIHMTMRFKVI